MRYFYLSLFFFVCRVCAYSGQLPEPIVWHKPEIIGVPLKGITPQSVPLTERYTMIAVYQNPKPDTALQLWKINVNDKEFWQMTTYGLGNQRSKAKIKPTRGIKTPCIYTAQQTVKKHDQDFNLAFADTALNVYEVAYFGDYLPALQKRMCQTYLALKYGITLDTVEYIAPNGDTIWRADGNDLNFYHRIHGIGKLTHPSYNLNKQSDFSFEDSIIRLSKTDMSDDFFAIVGDDNGNLSWAEDEPQEDNANTFGRHWQLKMSHRGTKIAIDIDADSLFKHEVVANWLFPNPGDAIPKIKSNKRLNYYIIGNDTDSLKLLSYWSTTPRKGTVYRGLVRAFKPSDNFVTQYGDSLLPRKILVNAVAVNLTKAQASKECISIKDIYEKDIEGYVTIKLEQMPTNMGITGPLVATAETTPFDNTLFLLTDNSYSCSAEYLYKAHNGRRYIRFLLQPYSSQIDFTLVCTKHPEILTATRIESLLAMDKMSEATKSKDSLYNNRYWGNTTGVETVYSDEDGFAVYLSPNPTSGEYNLHIMVSQPTEMSVVVRDATGKIVTQDKLGKITDYTYCGTLTVTGVYLVEVQDKNGKVLSINKLIVQ